MRISTSLPQGSKSLEQRGVAVRGWVFLRELRESLGADVLEAIAVGVPVVDSQVEAVDLLDVVPVRDAGDVAHHISRETDSGNAHLESRRVECIVHWPSFAARRASCPRVRVSAIRQSSGGKVRNIPGRRRRGSSIAFASAMTRHSPGLR